MGRPILSNWAGHFRADEYCVGFRQPKYYAGLPASTKIGWTSATNRCCLGNFPPFSRSHRIVGENPPESGLDWIAASIPFAFPLTVPVAIRLAPAAHPHLAPSLSLSIVALFHLHPASSSSPPAFPQLGVDRQDRYSGAVTKRDRSRCPRKEAARAPFPRSSRLFPRRIDRPVAALTSRGSVGLDLEPRDQENA